MFARDDLSFEPLRLGLDDRGRCLEIVRRDRQHFVLQSLDLASAADVAEDDHAAAELAVGVMQRTGAEAQCAPASTW